MYFRVYVFAPDRVRIGQVRLLRQFPRFEVPHVSNAHKHLPLSLIVVAASALLSLAACGSGSRLVKPVSVSETIAKSNDSATDAYTGRNGAGKATRLENALRVVLPLKSRRTWRLD